MIPIGRQKFTNKYEAALLASGALRSPAVMAHCQHGQHFDSILDNRAHHWTREVFQRGGRFLTPPSAGSVVYKNKAYGG